MKTKRYISWMALFLLLSCHNKIVVEKTKNLDNLGWAKDSIIQLQFSPEDSLKTYNIYFLVRNDQDYPYSNIFMIAKIENEQYKIIDTLEYAMADAAGHWLGSGIWDLKESKLVYKKNWQFKNTNPTKIQLRQAVRHAGKIKGDSILPGIKTIGIIIEENK